MDANNDGYLMCSSAIEVAPAEKAEKEGDVVCVAENVPTSDVEDGRNDDGTNCEWVSSATDVDNDDDDADEVAGKST